MAVRLESCLSSSTNGGNSYDIMLVIVVAAKPLSALNERND